MELQQGEGREELVTLSFLGEGDLSLTLKTASQTCTGRWFHSWVPRRMLALTTIAVERSFLHRLITTEVFLI